MRSFTRPDATTGSPDTTVPQPAFIRLKLAPRVTNCRALVSLCALHIAGCSSHEAGRELSVRTSSALSGTAGLDATLGDANVTNAADVSTADAVVQPRHYAAASVQALPDLDCRLYPAGGTAAEGLPVLTDEDGVARFYAVPALATDSVQSQTLECQDRSGTSSFYTVDLRSPATFAPNPRNIALIPGADRPALSRDPASYTDLELIQGGYGVRPDPVKLPDVYARWLRQASQPARIVAPKAHFFARSLSNYSRPSSPSNSKNPGQDGGGANIGRFWTGAVMTGESPNYAFSWAMFQIPTAIPGGDFALMAPSSTRGNAGFILWNGLGGFGTNALIQGGASVYQSPTAAVVDLFREYCCPYPGGGSATLPMNMGDTIESEEWYCDSNGKINVGGNYGCSWLINDKIHVVVDCTQATGSPCSSILKGDQSPQGQSAEFIAELGNYVDSWPAIAAPVVMEGYAETSNGNIFSVGAGQSGTINVDPNIILDVDFTLSSTQLYVTTAASAPVQGLDLPGWPATIFGVQPGLAIAPIMTGHNTDTDVFWTMGVNGVANQIRYDAYSSQAGQWSGLSNLTTAQASTYIGSPPSPVVHSGVIDVFWTGDAQDLWHSYYVGGTWYGPATIYGVTNMFSAPQAVSASPSNISVFWRGPSDDLWEVQYNGAWGAPQSLGGAGTMASPPHPLAYGNGAIDVVWLGADMNVWSDYFDGTTWHGPQSLNDGPLGSEPLLVKTSGIAAAFWMGTDGGLWYDFGFGASEIGGTAGKLAGPPRPISSSTGTINVFWKGLDGALWVEWLTSTGAWNGPASLGGSIADGPYPMVVGNNIEDVYWQGTDGNLWHKWYLNGWAGPQAVTLTGM